MGPQFNLDHEIVYGAVEQISALVQRVTCQNPSRFTFKGTGTYIVGGDRVAVIDPGPADDAHIDALVSALDGRTVTHLLITHTHGDHSPGAALLKTHVDAPTYGFGPHPLDRPSPDGNGGPSPDANGHANGTGDSSGADDDEFGFGFDQDHEASDQTDGYKADHAHDWDFVPDMVVGHGDIIDGDGFSFEALHTPGHISNHVCFGLRGEQSLFSGDHVMGWSTTVIPPPDGNLNAYLDSLRLLLPRTDTVFYPTHGAPITDPAVLVPALLAHRQARTDQILACLADGIDTIKDMVLRMYTHVDKKLYNPAGASVMSHLLALCETGAVTCSDPTPKPRSRYLLAQAS